MEKARTFKIFYPSFKGKIEKRPSQLMAGIPLLNLIINDNKIKLI